MIVRFSDSKSQGKERRWGKKKQAGKCFGAVYSSLEVDIKTEVFLEGPGCHCSSPTPKGDGVGGDTSFFYWATREPSIDLSLNILFVTFIAIYARNLQNQVNYGSLLL